MEKPVRQNTRDLAKAGTYLVAIGLLFGSFAVAGAALRDLPDSPFFGWATAALEPSTELQATRVSQVVANAREIRAALAKPIPRPEPLTPITAKLAYGHLKPGGNGASAVTQRKPKLPKAGMEAMAMDTSPSSFRASSTVMPELHKVY